MERGAEEIVLNLDAAVAQLNKKYGMGTAMFGDGLPKDPHRLPSGIFQLDFMLGGGLPVYQISVVIGPEHGGKTSTAISFMKMASKICWRCYNIKEYCSCSEPSINMRSVWADVEGRFDTLWAEAIGVSPRDYVLIRADDGNQYGDMICNALEADDCGLVILDSLAMLIPTEFTTASLEDKFIGTQSLLVRNLIIKVVNQLTLEHKRGHPCLVLFTNQLRSKIGVLFGSNEQTAGGWAARYAPTISIRMAKRAMKDKDKYTDKVREVVMAQKHAFHIDKFSVLKLGDSGEFFRATEDINLEKLKARRGDVLDHKSFLVQIERHGFMVENKKGFSFNGRVGTKASFITTWTDDINRYLQDQIDVVKQMKGEIIKKCLEDHAVSAEQ